MSEDNVEIELVEDSDSNDSQIEVKTLSESTLEKYIPSKNINLNYITTPINIKENIPDNISEKSNKSNKSDRSTKSNKNKQSKKKNSQNDKKPTVKRGPGRPCKLPKKNVIPRKGISKTPKCRENYVELLYDKPIILKKIIQFFKNLASNEIQVIFRPTEMIMHSFDNYKKSSTYVTIDCRKVNHYYCAGNIEIGLQRKDIELIFNTVNKEYNCVIISSNITSVNKNIIFSLEDNIKTNEVYAVDLIELDNKLCNEEEFLDNNYMISFKLSGHIFKEKINNIKSFTDKFSINQEDPYSPLTIEFMKNNKKVHTKYNLNDTEIELDSKLSGDNCFRIDIKVDYLKPIATAQIAEHIYIFIDENKKFMTKSYIDNGTIEIKTLTEIIDNRVNS